MMIKAVLSSTFLLATLAQAESMDLSKLEGGWRGDCKGSEMTKTPQGQRLESRPLSIDPSGSFAIEYKNRILKITQATVNLEEIFKNINLGVKTEEDVSGRYVSTDVKSETKMSLESNAFFYCADGTQEKGVKRKVSILETEDSKIIKVNFDMTTIETLPDKSNHIINVNCILSRKN
jgi:hypothetical protein